jgi:site-specific recombinase XerD
MQIAARQFYEYSISIRGFSKDTIRRYRYAIRSYCAFTGIEDITLVTNENIRALLYYGRNERKWSVNTYIVHQKSLLVFFRWCVKQGYLQNNPAEDIEVPKLEKRLPFKLTKQEALRLLEVISNYPYDYKFLRYRNHAIFATFIFAGLRKQELLNLKYADIDIENMTIFVRQGKGKKDRIVPMGYTLALSLKSYVDERKRLKKTCPEFFVSSNRNIGYTENGLKRLVSQLCIASGIKFTIHKLRHTFATLMLEGGCDIYSLSKMMGHSDIKTTTIYLSASVEHLRNQITKHPMNE